MLLNLRNLLKRFWRFAASLGFLVLLITFTPVLRYWVTALSTGWGTEQGNTLIVLGQDLTAPDMLGIGSYWRSFYATLVWRGNHFRRIVVTGKDAAPLMRDLMVNQGVWSAIIMRKMPQLQHTRKRLFVGVALPGTTVRAYSRPATITWAEPPVRTFRKAGVTASPLPFPDANKRLN